MDDKDKIAALEAVIAEALAEHDHADTCAHMLNPEYECNCWRSALSRVPQGAAEPDDGGANRHESFERAVSRADAAEPWTDDLPWLCTHPYHSTGARSRTRENPPIPSCRMVYAPRSREQYDAEEGNRG